MTNAQLVAVLLGAIAIIIVSVLDFHAPYKVSDIRYAVLRERYFFAIIVYATIAAIFYFLTLSCVLSLIDYLAPESAARLTVAIPATIAVVMLAPHLPLLHGGIGAVRSTMQALARYPQTVETLTAIISRSPIEIGERAVSEVTRELEGYGVSRKLIERALADNHEVLAVGAAAMIQQVCSLHVGFEGLRNDQQFRKFFAARKPVFDDLEKHYRRLLRRSARALLLAEDISASGQDPADVAMEISDFIAQECEDLRGDYQRLLAEAALSSASSRPARIELISSFGYKIFLPEPLPLAPLIVIFAFDFVASVAPIFVLPNLSAEYKVTLQAVGLCALAHAFALTLSVFFAVYPKASTNFARPSLLALPWRSYVLFGLASYLAGNAVLGLIYSSIDLASGWLASRHPLAASSFFSLIFLVNTVVLSILLDVRLRNVSLDYHGARLRDGVTLAVVMMSTMVILMVGFVGISAMYDMPVPELDWVYAFNILLFGVLGFVMGYLVPSTAEAYIEANRFIRRSAEEEGKLLGWATQEVQPRLMVGS